MAIDVGAFLRSLRRFGRVALSAAIGAGLSAVLHELQGEPLWFFIAPATTAVLSAIGKFIRDKWGLDIGL